MANKKVNQLTSKPSVNLTDLFLIADPTSGQAYKTTISDLGTAIGSGVSSVNGLVGAVVLDTDDIQELVSPTNKWFTDTRARAALSASSPLTYNSGTGAFGIQVANGSQNGYLSSADWTTFNSKQAALSGTGFVKISGTTISYDNSTYLTTSAAASTYLALAGGTLTGALNGTSATFTGDMTISSTNPRIYLTDTDNNPDYFISNTDGTFTIYDVTSSVSRFTLNGTTGTFGGNLTVGSIIKSGGTSAQFLKADGSVDSTAYVSGSGTTNYLPRWSSSMVLTDSFIYTNGNYTEIQGQGLTASMGIVVSGRYGSVANAPKIYSSDETTGVAHIELVNGGGEIRLGVEKSTGGQILPGSSAYATVLTAGLSGRNLEFGTNNTKRLTIDGTTGAVTLTSALSGTSATFSSTITSLAASGQATIIAEGSATSGEGAIQVKGKNSSGTSRTAQIKYDNADIIRIGTPAAIAMQFETNDTARLTIASTGAATFSSSVTAGNAILNESSYLLKLGNSSSTNNASIGLFNNGGQNLEILYASSGKTTFHNGVNVAANAFYIGRDNTYDLIVNSSGNVGIGTTSPNSGLHISSGATRGLRIDVDSGVSGFSMSPNGVFGIDEPGIGNGRFVINTSGYVGIGTGTPSDLLTLYRNASSDNRLAIYQGTNGYASFINLIGNDDAGTAYNGILSRTGSGTAHWQIGGGGISNTFKIYTAGQERMQITSGGVVKAQGNAGSFFNSGLNCHEFNADVSGDVCFVARNTSATGPMGYYLSFQNADPNNTTSWLFRGYSYSSGTSLYTIYSNGTTAGRSDIRLKKNIEPVRNGYLQDLCQLELVKYNWYNNEEGTPKELGLIAQQVETVFPGLVTTEVSKKIRQVEQEDGSFIDEEYEDGDFKSIKNSVLPYITIKALQELTEEVRTLKLELDTLKNK